MKITDPFGRTSEYEVRDGKIMNRGDTGNWFVSGHDEATVDEIPDYESSSLSGDKEIAILLREKYAGVATA